MSDDRSPSALLVLGMHRSGTSALTGALRLCGASPGDSVQLTENSIENYKGFWERRDMRQVCDALLHAAGADWWKIANLHLDAIPHAVLHEQRRKFQTIVAELSQFPVWILKEPRLCLLLPLLVDYIRRPTCIHVVRNPLEVAKSLHARNGFSIASGLALWEAYNIHALYASTGLPRTFVSYNSLISDPANTLSQLVRDLHDLSVASMIQPTSLEVGDFLDPTLYRQKVTLKETEVHLSPSQKRLWQVLLSGDVSSTSISKRLSPVALRHLLDLESTELSLQHYKSKLEEYRKTLAKRTTTIERREAQLIQLQTVLQEVRLALEKQKTSMVDATTKLQKQAEIVQARNKKIDSLTSAIRAREVRISAMRRSFSWRITAPLRAIRRLLAPHARAPSAEAEAQHARSPSTSKSSTCPTSVSSSPIEQSITTYVIPAAWWDAHPEAARDITDSGQAILLMGSTELPRGKNITRIEGCSARSLALAAVTTATAIEVDPDAAPALVAWERWKNSAERSEQREDTNVRMRTAASLISALRAECTSQSES